MTEISVRAAVNGDATTLSQIALSSKAYWGYSKAFMEACRDELQVTPAKISSNELFYFVAEESGAPQGFYALQKLAPPEWELEALFVLPDNIGKGLGKKLMQHAKSTAKQLGAESILIQGDPNAVGFYEAQGAVKVGERESGSVAGRQLPLFRISLTV